AGPKYACTDRFVFAAGDLDPSWSGISAPSHPIEIVDFEDWTVARERLVGIDAAAHVALLGGHTVPGKFWGFIAGRRYLVENVAELAASPAAHAGRFLIDDDAHTITYFANPGEDPTAHTVIAPQLPQLVVGEADAHDIKISGIAFEHANWTA